MRRPLMPLFFLLGLLSLPIDDFAAASGEQLRAALSGNTVQGSMLDSGAYAEFHTPDGGIRGAGYTGRWWIAGDQACHQYGTDPETCWGAEIEGDRLRWLKGGVEDGTGTVVPGNPNGF